MKKSFIIFLFIILSPSFLFADVDKKISIEEIEYSILTLRAERVKISIEQSWQRYPETIFKIGGESYLNSIKKNSKTLNNRKERRKHLRSACEGSERSSNPFVYCQASIIKKIFKRNERADVKRPGDIFYGLKALERLIFAKKSKYILHSSPMTYLIDGKLYLYTEDFHYDWVAGRMIGLDKKKLIKDVYPEYKKSNCHENYAFELISKNIPPKYSCVVYSDYTRKKLEKFIKNPSNEKVLGKPIIKYIKNIRVLNEINQKIGVDNIELLGDMLNASVKDVKKNKIRPDINERKELLKKYILMLNNIEEKLNDNKFKSLDRDVSKLSKIYIKLQNLKPSKKKSDKKDYINSFYNILVRDVDNSIDILSDLNVFIQSSSLKAKENKSHKKLAKSSIYFMNMQINLIINALPKKYSPIHNKNLSSDLFDENDLAELNEMIDKMIKKNSLIKSAKMTWSRNILNNHIDINGIFEKMNHLKIINSSKTAYTQFTAIESAEESITENLNKSMFNDVKKIVASVQKGNLNDISKQVSEASKEVSQVANEIVSEPSFKSSVTSTYPEPKFGGQSLKKLIAAGIIRR